MSNVCASILDFPRKVLSEDLWLYASQDKENELPRIKPSLRYLIISQAEKLLRSLNLSLVASNLYGGAASFQWAPGSDIDVSVYASGWPDNISKDQIEKYQGFFKKIEIPFMGFTLHLFLKPPGDKDIEVADAVYDVLRDEWIVPPLILPDHFDPDEYFKPFIKNAEEKCNKLDIDIGRLRRSWKILEKSSQALKEAEDPKTVRSRIEKEKNVVRFLIKKLSDFFITTRERRYALHDTIKEQMLKDTNVGRMARFQEPEILWKYLDRAGYNEFLHQMYKVYSSGNLESVLSKY
jgi:predicted nucleotidyltransferase